MPTGRISGEVVTDTATGGGSELQCRQPSFVPLLAARARYWGFGAVLRSDPSSSRPAYATALIIWRFTRVAGVAVWGCSCLLWWPRAVWKLAAMAWFLRRCPSKNSVNSMSEQVARGYDRRAGIANPG